MENSQRTFERPTEGILGCSIEPGKQTWQANPLSSNRMGMNYSGKFRRQSKSCLGGIPRKDDTNWQRKKSGFCAMMFGGWDVWRVALGGR